MPIPHNHKIREDFKNLLGDIQDGTEDSLQEFLVDGDAVYLYKSLVALSVVAARLSECGYELCEAIPRISRCILEISAIGYPYAAANQLRQVVEISAWSCYYVDHPIEYAVFLSDPTRPIVNDPDNPLVFLSSRPLGWYLDYLGSLAKFDRSGALEKSCSELRAEYATLSIASHARQVAIADKRMGLNAVANSAKRVVPNCLILLAAVRPAVLGMLDGTERAWFDWVIGHDVRLACSTEEFGINTGV